jgi:hypothetical protein
VAAVFDVGCAKWHGLTDGILRFEPIGDAEKESFLDPEATAKKGLGQLLLKPSQRIIEWKCVVKPKPDLPSVASGLKHKLWQSGRTRGGMDAFRNIKVTGAFLGDKPTNAPHNSLLFRAVKQAKGRGGADLGQGGQDTRWSLVDGSRSYFGKREVFAPEEKHSECR